MNLNLNYEGFETYLESRHELFDGISYKFKFENRYGISVVKHCFSYGHEKDLWEIAMLWWGPNGYGSWSFDIIYDYDILPDGVMGYLTDEQVREYLQRIKDL